MPPARYAHDTTYVIRSRFHIYAPALYTPKSFTRQLTATYIICTPHSHYMCSISRIRTCLIHPKEFYTATASLRKLKQTAIALSVRKLTAIVLSSRHPKTYKQYESAYIVTASQQRRAFFIFFHKKGKLPKNRKLTLSFCRLIV